jgi:hypothetical protein
VGYGYQINLDPISEKGMGFFVGVSGDGEGCQ